MGGSCKADHPICDLLEHWCVCVCVGTVDSGLLDLYGTGLQQDVQEESH